MSTKTVYFDECLVSMAIEAGLEPSDLKQAPDNQSVLNERDPAVCLAPGDSIALPQQSQPGKALALNGHTVLQVRKPLFRLAITLLDDNNQPVTKREVRFVWEDNPNPIVDTTDRQGIVRFDLPLSCRKGLLAYEQDGDVILQPVTIGTLRAFNDPVGKVQRLCALYSQAVTPRAAAVSDEESDNLLRAAADETDRDETDFEALLKGQSDL